MKYLHGFQEALPQVKDCLLDGGVALLPTDTVYGLAVHPTRPDAAARLFAMKRRPPGRNLPIMVASAADLKQLGVEINEPAARLIEAFFPGPLSLALGLREGESPSWLAGRVEVAVRVPDDAELQAVLAATGPLLVTSANLHEQATPESAESALAALADEPDLVIDGGLRQSVPSTLVNCNVPAPVIEREGAVSREQIEQVLR
ncbi:L-threonylcarbamoyladenylate synthase [Phytohabitans flavus]|uniref:L-threonylcarbamoyladenylate synthase n=1 Tax=Phytohabitans flavus TaxID=1076124 RepID=UPI0031E586A0